ncbi:MAG: M24 family metallopeptidase C-terminal domain-containing protein [Lachnospiraceae bacterium]|nr:M24 family metallopeptidase C-terminal domain-containing protein [Lachnospiraceae bacterium]
MCVPKCKTTDGEFLCFDPLTFVPLDKELIDPQYLSDREMAELNEYHRQCREEMLPYFESDKDRDIKQWLIDATEAISK